MELPNMGFKKMKSIGFGDTVAKIIHKTKMDKVFGVKKGCGACAKRRKLLNKVFPYENSIS